ncbi:MAG: hypothetical protein CL778_04585 [Chloroflexi bacterium]|nr:hypothetical protein [Chloroflexota bacterium]
MRYHRKNYGRFTPRSLQHPIVKRVIYVGLLGYLIRFLDMAILTWLVVQEFPNPSAAGGIIFFRFLPFLIVGPIFGVIADKISRIKIIFFAQPLSLFLMLFFGLGIQFDLSSLIFFYIYSFLVGSVFVLELIAKRTYLVRIMRKRKYFTSVLALETITLDLGWFIGANLGGILLSFFSPQYIYFFISPFLLINIFLLRNLPELKVVRDKKIKDSYINSLKLGLLYAKNNSIILSILLIIGSVNLFGFVFESLGPTYIKNTLKQDSFMFGLLIASPGLGSLIGASIFSVIKLVRYPGFFLVISVLLLYVCQFTYSFITYVYLLLFLYIFLGFVTSFFIVLHSSIILTKTDDAFRGRISGLTSIMIGLFPFAGVIFGFTGDYIGIEFTLKLSSILGIISLIIVSLYNKKIFRTQIE